MSLDSLNSLLIEQLRDLYNAETQYRVILPEMLTHGHDESLRQQLNFIVSENQQNIDALQRLCTELGVEPTGVICEAMRGLVREARHTLDEPGMPIVIDAAIIANAQRIAHYQIAGYGTARQFSRVLGHDAMADTLENLAEVAGARDHQLSKVADGGWFTDGINQAALNTNGR